VVQSYYDASTNLTTRIATTDAVLLRQDGGAELGFDLTNWEDGNFLLLWCGATIWSGDAAFENVLFTPRIEQLDGTLVQSLPTFGESFGSGFLGGCGFCMKVGPLATVPALRVRVHWRTRNGAATATIDPDGSGTDSNPCSFQMSGVQVRA
jgi:hypothetical protein